jgi:hypothetical protein
VTFGAACRDCPLRARCTPNKTGRALVLHPRDALLRAARGDWAAKPALREDYKKYRPNIERVISQVATRGGRRLKLRYRGTARNNAWLKIRTAALNQRNIISRGLAAITPPGCSPDHRTRSRQPGLPSSRAPARLTAAGRATTSPTRKGQAHCRTDGLVGALPAPASLCSAGSQ